MKKLTINKRHIANIPEKWNELTADLIRSICRATFYTNTPLSLKVQLFMFATNLRFVKRKYMYVEQDFAYWMRSRATGTILVTATDIGAVAKCFDFLFTRTNDQTVIESRITINFFPSLKNRWLRTLHGPDGALMNLTWQEFIRAETLYSAINKTSDVTNLNKLMAVLYRPAGGTNPADKRTPFNDHELAKMARHTRRLSPWQKLYIRMFYDGCRAFIMHKFKHAFSYSGTETENKTPIESFMMVSNALTANDPTKANQLRSSLLWDVLPALDALALAAINSRQQKQHQYT